MLKSDFYYELPENLIAQTPIEPRDASRLMVLNRQNDSLTHDQFFNIADYLNKGDLLVMNDSKVFPARLFGKKRDSDVDVEFLLLEHKDDLLEYKHICMTNDSLCSSKTKHTCIWETMVCPGRRLKKGTVVEFAEGLTAEILETVNNGNRIVQFSYIGNFYEILDKFGNMPVPPYITEKLQDNSRYNTVYAAQTGSVAAPTAGLHFTERVFTQLSERSIDTAYLTLHVGIGTFRPVKSEEIEKHKMHSERFFLPEETVRKIRNCKARGNRVVAVGTTSCRTLEANKDVLFGVGKCGGFWSDTDIFITPGYEFGVVDALITNFHLPESTLLMLVSALTGRDTALSAYEEAIRKKYRFFSFGDSMFIL